MKIGQEVFVHGHIDEIRKDVVIIRNEGGYFGTVPDELCEMPRWITDRNPTPEEVEAAGDVGFILCISGEYVAQTYDHAIDMSSNFYEDGDWYVHGVKAKWATIHGWMMPPSWEDNG